MDTAHVCSRRAQGRARAAPGAMHQRAQKRRKVPRRRALCASLDPLRTSSCLLRVGMHAAWPPLQADNLAEPKEVFQFMQVCSSKCSKFQSTPPPATQANEIGQQTMLFYAAYASYLELRGSYARADKVYQEGIQRYATTPVECSVPVVCASHPHSLAQPMERLQQKHLEFQHRMVGVPSPHPAHPTTPTSQARRIQRKAQQEAEEGPAAEDPDAPIRPSLGVIKQRRGLAPAAPRCVAPADARRGACTHS